jgi:hypothetical protein
MTGSVTQDAIIQAATGKNARNKNTAKEILKNQWEAWGFEEHQYGDQLLIPFSSKLAQGTSGTAADLSRTGAGEDYEKTLETYAAKGAVFGAAGVTDEYEPGENKAVDEAVQKAGPIDRNVVEQATPVAFDPRFIDIQRSRAPIVQDIPQRGQAGFTASYNVIANREQPLGFLSESEAIDLSSNANSQHDVQNEQKDMKIWVDRVNISDFTVRAEASLGYMDVTQMTFGQRMVAHALQKARAFFYGDPSVGSGSNDIEDDSAYEGMAKMATDANNQTDKSSFSSSSDTPLLTELKREVTKKVEESGLTYDSARFAVSPSFFDDLENEANPSVRIDSFDEAVNFGGRALSIKGVPVREYPNIREYTSLSSTNFTSDERDVFLYDANAVEFRALMPLTTVPLARVGLGEQAAMAEFGTLISRDRGEHLHYYSSYAA